jgi:hypothetical protein
MAATPATTSSVIADALWLQATVEDWRMGPCGGFPNDPWYYRLPHPIWTADDLTWWCDLQFREGQFAEQQQRAEQNCSR